MRSISGHIDGSSVAAEVRMERQKHKGSFLLLEGSTDARRLIQSVDGTKCSFVICFGKDNVIDATERLYDDGYPGILGMVDADFERIDGSPVPHECIVLSSVHDFDLEVALSDALKRYLDETCDREKLSRCGGHAKVPAMLMEAIKPLSVLRFANEREQLRYDLEKINHEEFFDGTVVNIAKMVDEVSRGRFGSAAAKADLIARVNKYMGRTFDFHQLTSGHDFCAALGLALRDRLGGRRPAQTWRREVELHLRLAFSLADMSGTPTYAEIRRWESDNPGYDILRKN